MATDGTNDYNAQKLTPSEVIVSRTLQSKNRAWSNVVWRTGKPALDSEWNLINDVSFEHLSNLLRGESQSGWLDLGLNKYPIGNSGTADTLEFYSNKREDVLDVPNAIVNGWPLIIGGINYTDTSLNSITLEAASTSAAGYRYDFVFLEVWRAQVRSRDENNNDLVQNKPSVDKVYAYGNTQYGGTHFDDDIVDPQIKPATSGIETSQRIQIQYRIRVVSDVTFSNVLSDGFEDTANVQGQGANTNPQVSGYDFTNMASTLNDSGLWRAGAGDEASRTALRTVDGYTYAIPMFKIYRRTQVAYDDTGATPADAFNNQQGNSTDLSSGVSDRPDGKFYDGIDFSDITDLRAKISLGNLNYDRLLDDNLHLLLMGQLESFRRKTLQYDSIADSDINGYTDFLSNEGCNGKRNIWSDAAVDQEEIFAEVKITTTSNSLDVYRSTGAGAWAPGDVITIQVLGLPTGTIIKATPSIYSEDKAKTDISSLGSWSGLNTSIATFTFSSVTGLASKDVWVYYDISMPEGQGISYVPNTMHRIDYDNYSSFPSSQGVVVRGERLEPTVTRFQDLLDHPLQNVISGTTYNESEVVSPRKQITVSPLIQSTSARDGGTRNLETETTDATNKIIIVPFKLQHLKGIYTAASGGTELATQAVSNIAVDGVDTTEDEITVDVNNYVAEMTSLRFDPSGAFSGAETELLIASGGSYGPVYQHRNDPPETAGTRIKLYDTSGDIFDIPSGMTTANFRWAGRRIAIRNGSGYGYDINDYVVDCTSSDNNGLFSGFSDGQQLWIDMDYLWAGHDGAELRLVYEHTPYQGCDIGAQTMEMIHKRTHGIFFNNGTGDGTVALDATGTSNSDYTPMSPKLPGSFNDYLRDGALIELGSIGTKRFDTDAIFHAAYDLYGYYGGGTLWRDPFVIPATPETTSRGFLGVPVLEVIFEDPIVDQTNAEFILPLLVRDVATGELFLLVQIGNKGIHKAQEGDVSIEFYRLNERLLIKSY